MKYVIAQVGDVILRENCAWLVIKQLKNDDGFDIIVVLHGDGTIGRYRRIYVPSTEIIRDGILVRP